jgi:hypothetical protein
MGLLDDLKKQAEQVKTQQASANTLTQDNLKLVESKMAMSFQYLGELLKQLVVLKPVNPIVYSIPGIGDLKDMQFKESFIDYRKTRINDTEMFDLISFFIRWSLPNKLVVDRDMPATAQKVRDALFGSGIKFAEEELKNARMATVGWRFSAESSLVTDVKIKADHQKGMVMISAKNLMRLALDDFAVPAGDINEAWLEDFAVTLLGQPGNFRKYRAVNPLMR